ncbi:MAG: phosphatidylserine synthase, partial [Pseudomonadota bacterium]
MPKPRDFQVFVAADAAYAAFEEAVLDARASVIGSFRVFDLMATLLSDRARAVGSTWFDLLADALARGVHVNIVISDFDPIYATALHQQSMRSLRQAAALS